LTYSEQPIIKVLIFRSAHEGAPIWSADIDPETGFLYTGGGDASVKAWPLEDLSLEIPTQLEYPKTDGDYARTVLFFNNEILLCLTTRGKLFSFRNEECRCVLTDDELSSYALMEVSGF